MSNASGWNYPFLRANQKVCYVERLTFAILQTIPGA